MADGIYVGMAAATARAAQLDSIADNLANVETPGFKAARPAFQAFLPPRAGSTDKVFAAAVSTGTDLRPGTTVTAAEGRLQVGTLEMGNVPALESTIAMIGAQRHFETAMQAIQTYKKLDDKAVEVGKIR